MIMPNFPRYARADGCGLESRGDSLYCMKEVFVPEDRKKTETRTTLVDTIWDFFTSLKLVIVLLLVLSVLSVAGTIIEQNKPLQEYYRFFKPETVELFSKLGLLDMYHSWWFTSCLALLALNIIACTMERYPFIMRGMKKQSVVLDEKLEAGLTNLTTIKYNLPPETVESRLTAIAKKTFSARPVVTESETAKHLFYEKGRYSRLAFFLTHLSVLVIFIGAITGSLVGFKGYVNINEGETISSVPTRRGENKNLNFSVKCNSFQVDFYPNGAPKDYRSDLSVIRDGKEVLRKTIRVNDPLDYEGITFYQSSYGRLPDAATFEIRGKDGVSLGTVSAPFGKQVDVPGGGIRIEVLDYREHFHLSDGSEAGPAYRGQHHPSRRGAGRDMDFRVEAGNEPLRGILVRGKRRQIHQLYGIAGQQRSRRLVGMDRFAHAGGGHHDGLFHVA